MSHKISSWNEGNQSMLGHTWKWLTKTPPQKESYVFNANALTVSSQGTINVHQTKTWQSTFTSSCSQCLHAFISNQIVLGVTHHFDSGDSIRKQCWQCGQFLMPTFLLVPVLGLSPCQLCHPTAHPNLAPVYREEVRQQAFCKFAGVSPLTRPSRRVQTVPWDCSA